MARKQQYRSVVGTVAALALIAAVVGDLAGLAHLTNRHVIILSSLASAGLGIDILSHRYEEVLAVVNSATEPYSPDNDGGDDDG